MAMTLKSTARALGVRGANEDEPVCSLQDNRIRYLDVKRVMDLFSRMEKLKKVE